ncbi:MAG: phosphoribosyltransferase [Hyphomicrobiales bacterium]|nr:MAG: phosphoribosyltransferase [Hyphomicrobiales bacterium]
MTDPTTFYWQDLLPDWPGGQPPEPPFRKGYPVKLRSGRVLVLPLRPLPDGAHAVASLIANQASFAVIEAIAADMASLAEPFAPDLVVGLPTLGLALAPHVAHALDHTRYAPLGYSRKYWYDEALSEPIHSITSPGSGKRLYLDPNLLPLLRGRRVCVVDDAVSTGSSLLAVHRLFSRVEIEIAAFVVAMKQTTRWAATLSAADPALPLKVKGVFGSPLFAAVEGGGYAPVPDTLPACP